MVPEVDLFDVLGVGNVFLVVFARHGSRWAVHQPVQLVEERAGLLGGEIWAWLMQESSWNLEVFSED